MDAEAIKQSLEGSGLRCTAQRYAVMAFLMDHKGHPTAAEIYEAVNRVDPRSSRATTYNNLRDLVKAGLARSALPALPVKSGDVWMFVEQPIKKARRRLIVRTAV